MTRTQPAEIKVLRGRSPGHDSGGRPIPPPLPVAKGAPDPPAWMSKEAQAEWERVVPELERVAVLAWIDRAALVAYCESWATFVRATREAAAADLAVHTATSTRTNPAQVVANSAAREMRRWAVEFGLTPAARAGMRVPAAGRTGSNDPARLLG